MLGKKGAGKRKSLEEGDEAAKKTKMPNPTDDEKYELVEYMQMHQNYAKGDLNARTLVRK